MCKDGWEIFALGHKKGKNCQKHMKNKNFTIELVFFASDWLESKSNHSQHSFLKSVESNSLFKMSDLKKKEDICQFSKIILFFWSLSFFELIKIYLIGSNVSNLENC